MKNIFFSNKISILFLSIIPISLLALIPSKVNWKIKLSLSLLLGSAYVISSKSFKQNQDSAIRFLRNELTQCNAEKEEHLWLLSECQQSKEAQYQELSSENQDRIDFQINLVKQEYDEKIKDYKKSYSELQKQYWEVCKQKEAYQKLEERLNDSIKDYQDRGKELDDFKLELDRREIDLGNKANEIEKYHIQYDIKLSEAQKELEIKYMYIEDLENRYRQLYAISNNQEKLLSLAGVGQRVSFENYLLNNILDVYLQFEIALQVVNISNKNNNIEYKFFLNDISKLSKANGKELIAALNNRISYPISVTENKDNQLTLLVGLANQSRKVESIKISKNDSISIDNIPDNWLSNIFFESCHDLIIGATKSGKSTLVDNLITLTNIHFGENTEVFILDPKYPLSDWELYTPQYKGLESLDIAGFKTSLDGLNDMVSILKARLKEATICKENNKPLPKFTPQIWVVDELLMLKDSDNKLYSEATELIARVGRALKIKIILLSQESNVAKNGLTIAGSMNFTRYYLKEATKIDSVLDREIKIKSHREKITNQLTEMVSKGERFYGLICCAELSPFVGLLPQPGAFSGTNSNPNSNPKPINSIEPQTLECIQNKEYTGNQLKQPQPKTTNLSGDLECKFCGGNNLKKYGTRNTKKGKKQRWLCGDCGKSFTTNLKELVNV